MPTLLDMLGIANDAPLHGKSLKPLLEGQSDAKGHDFIFAEVFGRSLNQKRGMEERSVLDTTHQLILRSHLDEPKVINADLRDMKPWINRVYGELVRREAEFPEASRMLQTMDPHALDGNPPLIELYDLQNDPSELHNLADDPAAKAHLDRLMTAFKKWHIETKDETMIIPVSGL